LKLKSISLTFIFILLLYSLTFSQTPAKWNLFTLENGLRVLIKENHSVPLVNICTGIKVGAKNEDATNNGATHLLEHLILFRGTGKRTGEQVGQEMRQHGAYFNGLTSTDWTSFQVSLPREFLEFGLEIHADMLFNSNFPAEALEEERQAVLEEINESEDNPETKAYYLANDILYPNHPYERKVLGPKSVIESIPRDSVFKYYKAYYVPNNMTLVIIGDVRPQETFELVKKYFASIPQGKILQESIAPAQKLTQVKRESEEKQVEQAYLILAFLGPKVDSPDQYALDLITYILGLGESSRMWKKIKEEKGLVNSISFNFYTRKYEGMLYAQANLDKKNIAEVEKEIIAILEQAKKGDFTERELQRAKNQIKTQFFLQDESGLNLANQTSQYETHIGYIFLENYPQNIDRVTLDDLRQVANKYFDTKAYAVATIVPQEKGEKNEKEK
jgi:zinc protease